MRSVAKGLSIGLRSLQACDLTESKWGHRVIDQIFREGRFAPDRQRRNQAHDRG